MVSRKTVVLALVLMVAGGAWAFADRSGEPVSAARQQAATADELSARLPLYRLLHAPTDAQWRIDEAQRQLTIACMTKLGFRYGPAPAPKPSGTDAEHPTPFGLETLTPAGTSAAEDGPSEVPQSKAFARALYGDPDKLISAHGKLIKVSRPADGCQAEAEKRLLGDERLQWLQLDIQLGEGEQEARKQLNNDPAFRAANARWAQCMHEAGFQQKDPLSLLYGLPRDTDLSTNSAAHADVRCKADTDYLRVSYTRLNAVQQTWLAKHASTLTAWNSLQRRQNAAAGQVLHAQ